MNKTPSKTILVRTDGALILQQRDDKPGIANPGTVSTWGGALEPDEQPLDAAAREINEETNLKLDPSQLIYWRDYQANLQGHGDDWHYYYFVARNISDRNLIVFEDAGFVIVRDLAELQLQNLTPITRQVLTDYYKFFPS